MGELITGYTTGTGALITVACGFKPTLVRLFDAMGGKLGTWRSGMADASCFLEDQSLDGAMTDPIPAIGTTAANVANKAFTFRIAGVGYSKAAVAAGTAPTATTIPQNKWGLFGWEIAADGTIDSGADAAGNAAGYASEALAIAALPAASANHVIFMYVTVMSTNVAGFVGATDGFADADVTANYYTNSDLLIKSGGITPQDENDNTTGRGFTIGTNAFLNKVGDTIYYEALRE